METVIGMLALCGTMVAALVAVIRGQQKTINNHLHDLQRSVDRLPCRNRPDCPEDHK